MKHVDTEIINSLGSIQTSSVSPNFSNISLLLSLSFLPFHPKYFFGGNLNLTLFWSLPVYVYLGSLI